ncbi:hypothetical protein [Agrobacterium tumefaciens]|uniref:hypothetical protein n=1 Tax=Agrobacterium tumefaciens TaxID=358 RepID=UPI0004597278|nr:hypothetical protein [Agrobacterium tumefaciens]CDN93408.1 hypothetical protein BN949_02562 [Agrobacterium tumefaciens]
MQKLLAILASLTVIVCGGVFLSGEWSKYQYRESLRRAKLELFRLAEAGPDEEYKVSNYCRLFVEAAPHVQDQGIKDTAKDCLRFGFH